MSVAIAIISRVSDSESWVATAKSQRSAEEMNMPISHADFMEALKKVHSSVSEADIAKHLKWKSEFGAS